MALGFTPSYSGQLNEGVLEMLVLAGFTGARVEASDWGFYVQAIKS